MQKCYGKIRSKTKPASPLFLAGGAVAQLPEPPASIIETAAITDWGLMANNRIGDCTAAALGHLILADTFLATGTPVVIPDDQVVAFYSACSGYDPSTGADDNGADEDTVCQQFKAQGPGGL